MVSDALFQKSLDEWTTKDLNRLDKKLYFKKLKVIVLPYGESVSDVGQIAKPLKYLVKKGDTLKKISEYFDVSYGELVNHLLNVSGVTTIYPGLELEIPRHFIDLSKA